MGITDDELVLYARTRANASYNPCNLSNSPSGPLWLDKLLSTSKLETRPAQVETIFLDEIVDVFVGGSSDAAKWSSVSLAILPLAVTIMYGTDFVNPSSFIFITKTPEEAEVSGCGDDFFAKDFAVSVPPFPFSPPPTGGGGRKESCLCKQVSTDLGQSARLQKSRQAKTLGFP